MLDFARAAALLRWSLPFWTGCALMRLIVAPVAVAQLSSGPYAWLCLAPRSESPWQKPKPDEDMANNCPHMLRPRKMAALV